MTHSEQLTELVPALVKARKAFKPFTKDNTATVGSYSYRYGDLASLFEATMPALLDNGLVLTQAPDMSDGHFYLVTQLIHTSGQWMRTMYPLAHFDRPQEQGSAITYAKRYAASALLGVAAEEDDDGQSAEQAVTKKQAEAPTTLKDLKIEPTSKPTVTRYVATFADGRKASTINDELGAMLRNQAKLPVTERPAVQALIERGRYGMDLVELSLVQPPADEPF